MTIEPELLPSPPPLLLPDMYALHMPSSSPLSTVIITVKTPPWWDFDWWEYDDDDVAERPAHQCLGQGASHLAVLQPTQVLMMERRLKELQGKR